MPRAMSAAARAAKVREGRECLGRILSDARHDLTKLAVTLSQVQEATGQLEVHRQAYEDWNEHMPSEMTEEQEILSLRLTRISDLESLYVGFEDVLEELARHLAKAEDALVRAMGMDLPE